MSNTSTIELNRQIQLEMRRIASIVTIPMEVVEAVMNSVIEASRAAVGGLPIGARAPQFSLQNASGELVSSKVILESSPLVVCFVRGDWCTFCALELAALTQIHPQITELGARLVVIHPQSADRTRLGPGLPFDVCSDASHDVMAAFDVRFPVPPSVITTYRDVFGLDLAAMNAGGLLNLPVPATFIIDKDGIVKGRQFNPDYQVRAEPSYILSTLAALPATSEEFVWLGDPPEA